MNPITVETGWRGRARPVGTLVVQRTRGNTRVGFGYRPEWLRDGYALEPGLPLHSGTQFPDGELFGCFQDSCPDRWGRTLIRRAEAMAAREGDRPART